MSPVLIVGNEFLGCHIPDRPVCPLLVVFPSPRLNHQLRFPQGQKPVFVETLIPKLAVEALDKAFCTDPDARLGVLEHCDDLFLRVPFAPHGPSCGAHLSDLLPQNETSQN
jgi:hypothetical protein